MVDEGVLAVMAVEQEEELVVVVVVVVVAVREKVAALIPVSFSSPIPRSPSWESTTSVLAHSAARRSIDQSGEI